jgi:hypothetical protein
VLADLAVAVKASGPNALISTPLRPRPSSKTTSAASKRYFFSIPGSSKEPPHTSPKNEYLLLSLIVFDIQIKKSYF